MPAQARTVHSGGHYRGHNYRIEQQMVQTLDGKGEFPGRADVYVDDNNNSILVSKEFGKPTEEFTAAEQSERAAKAHIDQLEAQKELDGLEDHKHPGTKIVLTIGRTGSRLQKHYEPL